MLLREGSQMSKFKPGDWVVNTTTDNYYKGIRNWFQLKETDLIFKQEVNAAEWESNCAFVNCHEIWQPKAGEWCWFWDENYTTAILAKFENISNGLFVEHHGNTFDYCEPFIGQLPTHLKDQS